MGCTPQPHTLLCKWWGSEGCICQFKGKFIQHQERMVSVGSHFCTFVVVVSGYRADHRKGNIFIAHLGMRVMTLFITLVFFLQTILFYYD